jgi:hypothetical protein
MVVMMTAWEVQKWGFSPRVFDQAIPVLSCSPCSAIGCSRWEEQVNLGLSCHPSDAVRPASPTYHYVNAGR